MLLDSYLDKKYPGRLDAYYQALRGSDKKVVESAVNRITKKPTDKLSTVIEKFVESRFLYDYVDDAKLLYRVNQVMQRVKLDQLPDTTTEFVAEARRQTYERAEELLETTRQK
jgi:hypothetical protein